MIILLFSSIKFNYMLVYVHLSITLLTLNPNDAIALPKLVIVLVLWVFAKNLRLTLRLIDDYL